MGIKQISPQDTHDALKNDPKAVYLDVRTEQEFRNGHVPGARNIAVFIPDPSTGRMAPNPEFVKTVEATFSKDTRLIVGCQAGPRSQQAALILEQIGFTDISNMLGGFGGARDGMGRVVAPGWLQLNLPVER
jgi:rhodanese-related sulfurtransferase